MAGSVKGGGVIYDLAILVTGDRRATADRWVPVIGQALDQQMHDGPMSVLLLHGAATGIDTLAANVAKEMIGTLLDLVIEIHPAHWDVYGKAAGPRRNETMLSRLIQERGKGSRVIVLAFHDFLPNSKGTGHMVRISRDKGLPVVVHSTQE